LCELYLIFFPEIPNQSLKLLRLLWKWFSFVDKKPLKGNTLILNMEKKVTFLFGAGASAQCLPIVKAIPGRLENFYEFIIKNRLNEEKEMLGGAKYINIEEMFIQECMHLIEVLRKGEHASIDTYAKKLRITGVYNHSDRKKYYILKVILSSFFIYEQMVNKVDNRYDSFFASILGDSHTDFPENISILSWNYDFQFEKAYSSYSGKVSLSENQSLLRVSQARSHWRATNQFGIYKLNGTTALASKETGSRPTTENLHDDLQNFEPRLLVKKFVENFNYVLYHDKNYVSALSFAWENWDESSEEFLKKTESAVAKSEALVIIGYSFPFFNRPIDKRMINAMDNSLEKIYIQDMFPDNVHANLLSVLPEGFKFEIIKPPSYDQFFLPPEL
jgi:hypothetical protein